MLLNTIRNWQLQALTLNQKTFASLLVNTDPDDLTRYRDGGDGWTAVEVLGHLRDFEDVFHQRAVLTVTEDNPPLPFPNPDQLAAEHGYLTIPWQTLLNEWQAAREQTIAYFKARDEDDWERLAQHPTRGPFTLHDQLFLAVLHDSIHLEQMTRILRDKL